MNYNPFHHKYRPQTFADLVGQKAIATTLTNAIANERIVPAYLFTGSRGTGKTSSARILAKSLNCSHYQAPSPNPCGKCHTCQAITQGSCLDVMELDAASNSGVEQIREIIERAQFAPVQARYKVYCIDECHALTGSAIQALLKTLEEPPANVVFVLCTTEPQKLPLTIISRTQRFNFRPIAVEMMLAQLKAIAFKEKIEITEGALQLVVKMAQGGLRDAETFLEQLCLLDSKITSELVWDLVGAVPDVELLQLVKGIVALNPATVLAQVREILATGKQPLVVLQNLTEFYTDLLVAKTAPDSDVRVVEGMGEELQQLASSLEINRILACQQHLRECEPQVKFNTQPQLWLEIALLGLLSLGEGKGDVINQSRELSLESMWQEVMERQTPALKALLQQHAQLVYFDGKSAELRVMSKSLKQRVENSLSVLQTAFSQITGKQISVVLS